MKAIFFLRSGSGTGPLATAEELDAEVEYGVITYGASLGVLEQMLSSIYLPVVSKSGAGPKGAGG